MAAAEYRSEVLLESLSPDRACHGIVRWRTIEQVSQLTRLEAVFADTSLLSGDVIETALSVGTQRGSIGKDAGS